MLLGLFYGAVACLLWGTVYIAPRLISTFSPAEILLGRYLAFGIFSLVLVVNNRKKWGTIGKMLPSFKVILCLAVFGFFLYDLLEVVNIRLNGSETVGFIYGATLLITPMILNFFPNKRWPSLDDSLRVLLLLLGLVLLEWQRWNGPAYGYWSLGCAAALVQGFLWIYFTRTLSKFTAKSSGADEAAHAITVMIGVVCFFLSISGWGYYAFSKGGGLPVIFSEHLPIEWGVFIGVSLISGVGCAWFATRLWCRASSLVPYSLLSNLLLADVVAGRVYAQIIEGGAFSPYHLLGVMIVIGGGALTGKSDRSIAALCSTQE